MAGCGLRRHIGNRRDGAAPEEAQAQPPPVHEDKRRGAGVRARALAACEG
jgi:hypothetical protein